MFNVYPAENTGFGITTQIVNSDAVYTFNNNVANARSALSGAMTANTLKTLLSVTGKGSLKQLAIYTQDNTSRIIRVRVTVDGVVVWDKTSTAITAATTGFSIVGFVTSTGQYYGDMNFAKSVVVEVSSSVSETDKLMIAYQYWGIK